SSAFLPSCPPALLAFFGSSSSTRLELIFVFIRRRQHPLAERLLEPLGERARCVVPAGPKQLIARGNLDEDGDVPSRCNGHADERHAEPEDLVELVVEA